MTRSSFIRNSGTLLTALALFTNRSMAQLLADPAYQVKMLTKQIGIFTEKGGTILFMLSKEGIVVVDAQFPDTSQHLMDELKKQTTLPYRLLINTHHHGDHTSGNIAYKGLVQHVLAHENSKANQQRTAKEKNNEAQQLYPDQTFGTTWCETIGEEEVCLQYFGAGHTNGDSLVHFRKANIIHLGDLMFNRRHPYIDKSSGASIANWITVLDKAYDQFGRKARYVCGHAAGGYEVVVKRDDLKQFGTYLGAVLQYTEDAIKTGKTKEEILKTTSIPNAPADWKGEGIERALSAAYAELSI